MLVNKRLGELQGARAIRQIGEHNQGIDCGFGHGVRHRAARTIHRAERAVDTLSGVVHFGSLQALPALAADRNLPALA